MDSVMLTGLCMYYNCNVVFLYYCFVVFADVDVFFGERIHIVIQAYGILWSVQYAICVHCS